MLYNSLSDRMKQAVDAGIVELSQLEATSKNYFLVIWAGDFSPEKVLKTPEYFVYCGVFKRHLWTERFVQSPKGEFLEVPYNLSFCKNIPPGFSGRDIALLQSSVNSGGFVDASGQFRCDKA